MNDRPDDQAEQQLRERALAVLKKKRDFTAHLLAYLVVNAMLVAIWYTTSGHGFFWPIFPIAGWGIGVFFQGWDVYRGGPTEEQIQREMQRLR